MLSILSSSTSLTIKMQQFVYVRLEGKVTDSEPDLLGRKERMYRKRRKTATRKKIVNYVFFSSLLFASLHAHISHFKEHCEANKGDREERENDEYMQKL